MENTLIINKKLDEIISLIKSESKENLHILSDFDRTLTKYEVNGKKVPSVISILRKEKILGNEYSKRAYELFNKYHPIEIDPNISMKEKKEKMKEWWTKHFQVLIDYKLNIKDIEKSITNEMVELRNGVPEFLKKLNKENIPLIIMSSGGLAKESITMILKNNNCLYDNIYIVANEFSWNKNGDVTRFKEPIIHVFNKDETTIPKDISEKVKNRKNVILLGDSLGDALMIGNFDYDNLIKIGFLYNLEKENLSEFKKNYDVIILNDGDFSYINSLLEKVI
jgi:5'-nucleotidase